MKRCDFSVLLIDGESDFALFVARCLAQVPGLKLHILSNKPWMSLRFSRHRHTYRYHVRENEYEQWLDVIHKTVKKTGADVMLPVDEPAIHFVSTHLSTIAKMAALPPIPETQTFETLADKGLLAKFLTEHEIPGPVTILCNATDKFDRNFNDLPFPVLIKPTRARGGEGIKQFDTQFELLDFLGDIDATAEYVVQSFVSGYDVDCSVLCDNGNILAYTIQRGIVVGTQNFSAPAGIDFIHHDQVLEVIEQLFYTTRFSGIAHVDLRYDEQDERPKIIEVNVRYWGSLVGSLIVGVNFPYLACLVALGIEFPLPDYHQGRYIAPGAAIKQGLGKFLGRSKLEFTFKQTGLPFALSDPVAEVVKFVKQALSNHR